MTSPDLVKELLEVIGSHSPRPLDLLEIMSERWSYQEIQDALAELMEQEKIVLSSDLHLRRCGSPGV